MAKRTFEEDLGVVGEIETFGDLMPVMEGRRSDFSRLKQLKNNGLYRRLKAVGEMQARVYREWLSFYGTPKEKKEAKGGAVPIFLEPTHEEIVDALRLMVHVYNHHTTRDALRVIGLSTSSTMYPSGKPMHTNEACEILARLEEGLGHEKDAASIRQYKDKNRVN